MSNKVFHIFISSRFNTFESERKIIRQNIEPRLKKMCSERGFLLEIGDFRRGINEKTTPPDKIIPICMKEVQKSLTFPKPNFLILLGDTGGSVFPPSEMEQDEFKIFYTWMDPNQQRIINKWYKQDFNRIGTPFVFCDSSQSTWENDRKLIMDILSKAGRSALLAGQITEERYDELIYEGATEREIREGYLYKSGDQKNAIVVLRKDWTGSPDTRENQRVRELKEELRLVTDPDRKVELDQSDSDYLQQFEQSVFVKLEKWLTGEMDRIANEEEKQGNDYYQWNFVNEYCSDISDNRNIQLLDQLKRNLQEKKVPLFIHGVSGSGKTTLLCLFAEELQKAKDNPIILLSFRGHEYEDGSILNLLNRFAEGRVSEFSYYNTAEQFQLLLHQLAREKREVFLLIDGLDQYEDWELLETNPLSGILLPSSVHVIVTITTEKYKSWFGSEPNALELQSLQTEEKRKMMEEFLQRKNLQISNASRNFADCLLNLCVAPSQVRLAATIFSFYHSFSTFPAVDQNQSLMELLCDSAVNVGGHGKAMVYYGLQLLAEAPEGISEEELCLLLAGETEIRSECPCYAEDDENTSVQGGKKEIPAIFWMRFAFDIGDIVHTVRTGNDIYLRFVHNSYKEEVRSLRNNVFHFQRTANERLLYYVKDQGNWRNADRTVRKRIICSILPILRASRLQNQVKESHIVQLLCNADYLKAMLICGQMIPLLSEMIRHKQEPVVMLRSYIQMNQTLLEGFPELIENQVKEIVSNTAGESAAPSAAWKPGTISPNQMYFPYPAGRALCFSPSARYLIAVNKVTAVLWDNIEQHIRYFFSAQGYRDMYWISDTAFVWITDIGIELNQVGSDKANQKLASVPDLCWKEKPNSYLKPLKNTRSAYVFHTLGSAGLLCIRPLPQMTRHLSENNPMEQVSKWFGGRNRRVDFSGVSDRVFIDERKIAIIDRDTFLLCFHEESWKNYGSNSCACIYTEATRPKYICPPDIQNLKQLLIGNQFLILRYPDYFFVVYCTANQVILTDRCQISEDAVIAWRSKDECIAILEKQTMQFYRIHKDLVLFENNGESPVSDPVQQNGMKPQKLLLLPKATMNGTFVQNPNVKKPVYGPSCLGENDCYAITNAKKRVIELYNGASEKKMQIHLPLHLWRKKLLKLQFTDHNEKLILFFQDDIRVYSVAYKQFQKRLKRPEKDHLEQSELASLVVIENNKIRIGNVLLLSTANASFMNLQAMAYHLKLQKILPDKIPQALKRAGVYRKIGSYVLCVIPELVCLLLLDAKENKIEDAILCQDGILCANILDNGSIVYLNASGKSNYVFLRNARFEKLQDRVYSKEKYLQHSEICTVKPWFDRNKGLLIRSGAVLGVLGMSGIIAFHNYRNQFISENEVPGEGQFIYQGTLDLDGDGTEELVRFELIDSEEADVQRIALSVYESSTLIRQIIREEVYRKSDEVEVCKISSSLQEYRLDLLGIEDVSESDSSESDSSADNPSKIKLLLDGYSLKPESQRMPGTAGLSRHTLQCIYEDGMIECSAATMSYLQRVDDSVTAYGNSNYTLLADTDADLLKLGCLTKNGKEDIVHVESVRVETAEIETAGTETTWTETAGTDSLETESAENKTTDAVTAEEVNDGTEATEPASVAEAEKVDINDVIHAYAETLQTLIDEDLLTEESLTSFGLVYIDSDNIPELFTTTAMGHMAPMMIYTYSEGECIQVFNSGSFAYAMVSPGNNIIEVSFNQNGMVNYVYSEIAQDTAEVICELQRYGLGTQPRYLIRIGEGDVWDYSLMTDVSNYKYMEKNIGDVNVDSVKQVDEAEVGVEEYQALMNYMESNYDYIEIGVGAPNKYEITEENIQAMLMDYSAFVFE